MITETVFSWPGLGLYLTGSLLNADMNAVLGATLVVGAVYLLLNLMADMAYHLLDPRVRDRAVPRVAAEPDTGLALQQAAWVRRYRGWLQFRTNGLAMVGLVTVIAHDRRSPHRCWRYRAPVHKTSPAGSRRHRWNIGSALTNSTHLFAHPVRRPRDGMVVAVVLLVAPIGLAVGSVAGYLGGMADRALMRLTDIFLAFPRLVLALAFVAALRQASPARSSPSP